jgi:hypothetical protein
MCRCTFQVPAAIGRPNVGEPSLLKSQSRSAARCDYEVISHTSVGIYRPSQVTSEVIRG